MKTSAAKETATTTSTAPIAIPATTVPNVTARCPGTVSSATPMREDPSRSAQTALVAEVGSSPYHREVTQGPAEPGTTRSGWQSLVLLSCLMLFLELALIRLVAAHNVYVRYFT